MSLSYVSFITTEPENVGVELKYLLDVLLSSKVIVALVMVIAPTELLVNPFPMQ